jgi:hypothetical protein
MFTQKITSLVKYQSKFTISRNLEDMLEIEMNIVVIHENLFVLGAKPDGIDSVDRISLIRKLGRLVK